MPQLFNVLKCFRCLVFQVHQTKKSNKWLCQLCGEKQSIKRHYGIGTAKECRLHVQKLNGIRGDIDVLNDISEISKTSDDELEVKEENCTSSNQTSAQDEIESKWSSFVDKLEQFQPSEGNEKMFLGAAEVVLEVPAKKRKQFNAPVIHDPYPPIVNTLVDTTEPKHRPNETFCKPYLSLFNKTFYKSNSSQNTTITKVATFDIENKLNSKVYNPNNLSNNVKEATEIQDENLNKASIPSKVNKKSKWAQFTDEPEDNENAALISKENSLESVPLSEKHISVKAHSLFTLCDENELDDVLGF